MATSIKESIKLKSNEPFMSTVQYKVCSLKEENVLFNNGVIFPDSYLKTWYINAKKTGIYAITQDEAFEIVIQLEEPGDLDEKGAQALWHLAPPLSMTFKTENEAGEVYDKLQSYGSSQHISRDGNRVNYRLQNNNPEPFMVEEVAKYMHNSITEKLNSGFVR